MEDLFNVFYDDFSINSVKAYAELNNIVVINLDKSEQRMRKMSEQLNGMGLNHERLSAVNGYNVTVKVTSTNDTFLGSDLKKSGGNIEFNLYNTYHIDCYPQEPQRPLKPANFIYTTIPHLHPPATAGELGCTCSHRKILADTVDHKRDLTVVLEDDITIKENFKTNTLKAFEKLPDQAHMLYLHLLPFVDYSNPNSTVANFSTSASDIGEIERFWGSPYGTQAYVVTLEGAKRLLDLTYNMTVNAIDEAIITNRHHLNIFSTLRSEIESSIDPDHSEIHKMGRLL